MHANAINRTPLYHGMFLCSNAAWWEWVRGKWIEGSGADSVWNGGHVPPLLHMAGHGGTVSRRTANKKLTKLY